MWMKTFVYIYKLKRKHVKMILANGNLLGVCIPLGINRLIWMFTALSDLPYKSVITTYITILSLIFYVRLKLEQNSLIYIDRLKG